MASFDPSWVTRVRRSTACQRRRLCLLVSASIRWEQSESLDMGTATYEAWGHRGSQCLSDGDSLYHYYSIAHYVADLS